MTTEANRKRARRKYLFVLAAACLAVMALAVSAARDGLTYYRTTTEAHEELAVGVTLRIGGLVIPGSVQQNEETSTLLLTDGATDVTVAYPGRMPAVVREGEGAVVHGSFDSTGVFQASEILLRHSNEYRAPSEAPG